MGSNNFKEYFEYQECRTDYLDSLFFDCILLKNINGLKKGNKFKIIEVDKYDNEFIFYNQQSKEVYCTYLPI